MDAWLIYFEDVDVRPEIFTGEGAEQAARHAYKRALTNWNCHLFQKVAEPPHACVPKLIGNAMSGPTTRYSLWQCPDCKAVTTGESV